MLLCAWAYILEPSRERSIIKKHLRWGAFLMLLLIAECDFTKKKILLQTFPNKSSKTDYQKKQYNNLLRGLRLLLAKLCTNPLKFHLSRFLVPVNRCNLALLPYNCNA